MNYAPTVDSDWASGFNGPAFNSPGNPGMSLPAQRIERLGQMAEAAAKAGEFDRSRTYVRRARRIAERKRLSLPTSFDRRTCNRCDVYLRPGENARVRVQGGAVVITCDCGHHQRYPID